MTKFNRHLISLFDQDGLMGYAYLSESFETHSYFSESVEAHVNCKDAIIHIDMHSIEDDTFNIILPKELLV